MAGNPDAQCSAAKLDTESSAVNPDMQSTSNVAEPASSQMQCLGAASEITTLTLPNVLSKFSSRADAQQLLQDHSILQEWQCASRPSHQVRDAMCSLGTRYKVPRYTHGKKRKPSEVAQEIEENILKQAKTVIADSVATPSQSSTSSAVKPATDELQSFPAATDDTTLSLQDVLS